MFVYQAGIRNEANSTTGTSSTSSPAERPGRSSRLGARATFSGGGLHRHPRREAHRGPTPRAKGARPARLTPITMRNGRAGAVLYGPAWIRTVPLIAGFRHPRGHGGVHAPRAHGHVRARTGRFRYCSQSLTLASILATNGGGRVR